ncbi:KDO2-lipid IV(A) lauroyltransferase [Sinosporangium album]|uniref:KDO2-lipid IV(A) lauroyltransferase n=1 Tax=Sinosporangium album TaxID=504805 RepID=A0A1G8IUW4_9ACTN|nr:phosphatidylinositol mannoside acyltransferase [Sinosporangium album]SDI22666.1 KDO2-lipid IV(A) lauroyltransferase [Sinosporangium album]
MKLQDRLVASLYAVAWFLVPRVPERLAAAVFRVIADEIWRRRGKPVRQLERNLARVLGKDPGDPAVRRLSRAGLRSYFRYWMEVFRLPAMSRERILTGMHVQGEDHIVKAVASGRGIVLALPHMGNWDQAGAWLVHFGHPFTTVAERLKPESLFERWLAFRRSLGMEVLPLTAQGGGTAHAFGTLARRLREGGVVCLPADRDLTDSGIEVDFFGSRTRMVAGPALLAIQTGASMHPATLWFEGDDWGLHIHPEIPVPEYGTRQEKLAVMVQAMADVFAEGIAEHPDDWHMLQRLWLDDLRPRA